MKKWFIIVLVLLPFATILAQDETNFKQLSVIGNDIIDFTIDNLGNIYTLDKNNQLKKLTEKGDSVGIFNDVRRFGKVYSIDATNPLKILLFYKDFGTIVVLDRFLNIRNTIDIRKLGILQAKAIAQSYDNGIWIYDELEAKLKRLNDDGVIVDQSADFRQTIETAPAPMQIIDQEKLVYLYDTAQGLFAFDYFGTFKYKIGILGWHDFQVIGSTVFGRKGSFFERYQLDSLVLKEQQLDAALADTDRIKIAVNRIYSLKNGSLTIYER